MGDNQVVKTNVTNELARDNASAIAAAYEQKARKYLSLVGQDLPDAAITPFLELCKELELNPFKQEVYAVPYKNYKTGETTLSIITSYMVYLKRADRIDKMDGWHCEEDGQINDMSYNVTLIINRKDWKYPFKHTVYLSEVYQKGKDGKPNSFWQKQPRFMTKKVAIAQGFRLCFPDEFGGMPYIQDEIPQGEIPTKVINDGNGNVCEVIDDTAQQQRPQPAQPQPQQNTAGVNQNPYAPNGVNPPPQQEQPANAKEAAKQIQEAINLIWATANKHELTDQDRKIIADGLKDRRNHTKGYFKQVLDWLYQKPMKQGVA